MCEHLETRSDKWISSDKLCNLANIILNNNYVENEKLKYHKKGVLPLEPSLLLHILTFYGSGFKPFLWLAYLDEMFCI